MKKFEDWHKEKESLEEGLMRNLALGGAMLGAGMGVGCSDGTCKTNPTKSIPSSSVTSDDAKDYLQNPESNYNWNDQIGRYTAEKDSLGNYIYKTKNGNFKRTKNVLGQDKFIKIK